MEQTPLVNALRRHQAKRQAAFHTPGHKGNPSALPKDLLSLDFTELPDTDSLFEASGPILAAERHAAKVLGTHRTLFSAGGCTLCIQAMLRLVSMHEKRKIIASRVLHRSAVNTMALLDLEPVWLMPTPNAGPGVPGRVTAQTVAQALQAHPDAGAVYLTSPDYFGVLSPIQEIAAVCRQFSVPLLVDNAHGAHLFYTSQPHPLTAGAAMTADSPHKTLPVLTGGAWLHLSDDRFDDSAKDAMALFGSTSPSYPIMASLDLCADWLSRHGKEAYPVLEQQVAALKEKARALGYTLPQGDCDPTRLSLGTGQLSLDGVALAQQFRQNGVEPEHWDSDNIVFIATPWNTPEELDRLSLAMERAAQTSPAPRKTHPPLPSLPKAVLSPRQAMFAPWEVVPLSQAVGRIASDAACPCPPGVPVVMPGERITEEITSFLHRYGFLTAKVVK
ncbi:MAG: DegT/DnrJ/EryC1/StrS family aminotransferase [Oscillospiraceae bacterium]|nr:DegT/DnrJ/EryC1/StrS family aminotransferase [Oscillospiraceae bacterium]